METLSERSHMLYLALDNSLQDCADLPTSDNANSDIVKDYKKMASKCPNSASKSRRKCLAQPDRPRVLIYSRDINDRRYDENNIGDADWNLVAFLKVSDHTLVALVTLNGSLCRISIQSKLNKKPHVGAPSAASSSMTTPSPITTPDIQITPNPDEHIENAAVKEEVEPEEVTDKQPELFLEVAAMSESKCGLGVAELDGKLFVVGGYDRANCLKSVESYCPQTNAWTQEMNLSEARGRVQIAVIEGTVYAVGGCNGSAELDTVECLHNGAKKWKKCCKLPFSRSNAGVCALNDQIFCIGGWNGQSGIKQCDVYAPKDNNWTSIAPLNTGRYQAGVTAFKGKLWCVGGSDAWNVLNTCEVFDPVTNQWTFTAPLLTSRRGCGLAEFNGKLYVVGGSDGSHSLKSTEYYCEETKTWVVGPNLTTARSIVSVVVVQDRLYAIGGFSGKTFLNTVEYLDSQSNEWTTFVPQNDIPAEVEAVKKHLNNGMGSISSDDEVFDEHININGLKLNDDHATHEISLNSKSAVKTNNCHNNINSSNNCNNINSDSKNLIQQHDLSQQATFVSSKNTINDDDEDIPLIN